MLLELDDGFGLFKTVKEKTVICTHGIHTLTTENQCLHWIRCDKLQPTFFIDAIITLVPFTPPSSAVMGIVEKSAQC